MKHQCLFLVFAAFLWFTFTTLTPMLRADASTTPSGLRIGNFDFGKVTSITFIQDDAAAFVMRPNFDATPGMAAPDDSIHKFSGKGLDYAWGRVGNTVVARLTSDHPIRAIFALSAEWPGFVSTFMPTADGIKSDATLPNGTQIVWQLTALCLLEGKERMTSSRDDATSCRFQAKPRWAT